ncbi:hypothetical protein C5167_012170 [Papaver somniferum]|uniref:Uncharacterized protein n=1 Tax=Papaver somniferum TaxID=3469 RepID=A0A4Y7IXD9_PAPSO|nr:hypothetical protein C5167_012170 [Papaver somniferum]
MGASVSVPNDDPHYPANSNQATEIKEVSSEVVKDNLASDNSKITMKKINSKTEIPAAIIKEDSQTAKPVPLSGNRSAKTVGPDNKNSNNNDKLAPPLPHKYNCIIQEADTNINQSELHSHLSSGILLNQKKQATVQKYWIDDSGCNCFMLFPRSLAITWAEDKRYWHWPFVKESSTSDEMAIEVAELLNVCWLEANGKLDISKLTPGVKYDILFVVMLKNSAYGWEAPVNLRLVHPDGKIQQREENLQVKPKSQWIELHVGEFPTPPQPDDKQEKEIQFSLFEYEDGKWKRGLVIKGVILRPKK